MKTLTSKISSHADVVGMIPHILGYTPADSLVLVTVLVDDGRTVVGPCVRLDFGYERATRFTAANRMRILELVEEAGDVRQVIPVLFSDEMARAHGTGERLASPTLFAQYSRPMLRICDELVDEGYQVFSPLWAGLGAIGTVGEQGILQALADAQSSPPVAEMVASGSSAHADFDQAAALPPVDEALRDAAAALHGEPLVKLLPSVLESLVALYDLAVAADTCGHDIAAAITPEAVAGITRMMEEKWSRDGLEMMLGFDHPDFPVDVLRAAIADADPAGFLDWARPVFSSTTAALEIVGLSRRRPDMHVTDYSVAYLKSMAVHCDPAAHAMLLAVLGWFEWARGKNSFGVHYARQALRLEPDNVLAGLAVVATEEGLPPGWMRGVG